MPKELRDDRPREGLRVIQLLVALASSPTAADAQAGPPERVILEGVPYIGPEWAARIGHPSDFALPSAVRAVMQYLGEDPDKDYFLYLAASGIGFQQLWDPKDWKILFDNHWLMDEDPMAPVQRS